MIARARLADGKELLPGHYQIIVLELAVDGKILSRRVSVPTDIDLNEFLSRLDSWDPPNSEQDKHLIDIFRRKLDYISAIGDETQTKKANRFSCQVDKFGEIEAPGSEKSSWIFQLRFHAKYSIPFGKSPDAVRTWSQLKEATCQELLDGIRAKKHPVFVRVSAKSISYFTSSLTRYELALEDSIAPYVARGRRDGKTTSTDLWPTRAFTRTARHCGCNARWPDRRRETTRGDVDASCGDREAAGAPFEASKY